LPERERSFFGYYFKLVAVQHIDARDYMTVSSTCYAVYFQKKLLQRYHRSRWRETINGGQEFRRGRYSVGRINFRVPAGEGILPGENDSSKTRIVELDLSAENELRFHLTPDQLYVYNAWILSGTKDSFNVWLSKQKRDDKRKSFVMSIL
jgi:hypothetical protein